MYIQRLYYGGLFLSLVVLDYTIGNGFVDGFQRLFSKITGNNSHVKKEKEVVVTLEPPISMQIYVLEIVVLVLTMLFLNKYKHRNTKDHIDQLIQESKDTLKETNDLLEKWRQRRVPSKLSYLYSEPRKSMPVQNFEVPVLHMAIIDKRTPINMPERGDAANVVNITDSELLSVTSLIDDDLESMTEATSISETDKMINEMHKIDYRSRFLNLEKTVN